MTGLVPRPPPRPGTSATPRSSSARPPSGRQPSSRTPKADNISDDVLMEMQFAAVAESLRRTCFLYANRFVEVQHGGSGDEFDDDAIGDELADGKQKVFMHQLPNTDAGPYDSARVSPSVLVAIAEDMMITHHLLHPDEVKAAVVETLERRNKRAHLPATMDKTLHDFLIVCANRVMAKKPFCNVYGSATIRQKVRALVDFVCLDYQQVIDDVLDLRFSVGCLLVSITALALECTARCPQAPPHFLSTNVNLCAICSLSTKSGLHNMQCKAVSLAEQQTCARLSNDLSPVPMFLVQSNSTWHVHRSTATQAAKAKIQDAR